MRAGSRAPDPTLADAVARLPVPASVNQSQHEAFRASLKEAFAKRKDPLGTEDADRRAMGDAHREAADRATGQRSFY